MNTGWLIFVIVCALIALAITGILHDCDEALEAADREAHLDWLWDE